ncbi:MAG: 3-deoxy-manno-octulosonate cytidylyltransferase [Paracoccaceae bacterium]
MSVAVVIPARHASTRYPGKPLVALRGATGMAKTLIERSWEAARAVPGVERVVVATDDARIRAAAEGFGAQVVMTPAACRNGTERCAATLDALGEVEIVVNLQGDAPLTPPWFVTALIEALRAQPSMGMATPVLRCDGAALAALRADRAAGRVGGTTAVMGEGARAVYFSKEVVPFAPGPYAADDPTPVFHHVGCYAYTPAALRAYADWPATELEGLEGLEQLRFLAHGAPVLCVPVEARGRGFWELNNPSDVARIEGMMAQMGMA